ncbi:MAG: PAS domain S-box protein, partial [Gemmatimonadetes bacterium]|nr:PAS domain S-box protein [Gemmatimonadota bacterium]
MHDDLKPRQELEAEVAELRRRLAELEGPASHPLDAVETLATFDNDTDAMQASDAWFREMFEHGQGLMCTHSLDGILIAINPAAAKSLGYDPSELIGRPMAEFLNPRARHLFPTYLKRVKTHGTDSGILNVMTKQGESRVWVYRNAVV